MHTFIQVDNNVYSIYWHVDARIQHYMYTHVCVVCPPCHVGVTVCSKPYAPVTHPAAR